MQRGEQSFIRRESQDGGRQARQVGDNPDLACGSPGAVLPRGHCAIPPLIATVGDATGIWRVTGMLLNIF